MADRVCVECKKPLPESSTRRRKYCPEPARCKENHDKREWRARKRARELALVSGDTGRLRKEESVDGRASSRRGEGYDLFCEQGWPQRLQAGSVKVGEVATAAGVSAANVSRWMAAWLEDDLSSRRQAGFQRSAVVEALLEPTPEAFASFRARYFVDEWSVPYVTIGYHLAWIGALMTALATGGRLMILSPPRHGKTQLLIHFAVWLIIRNPEIRIVWIGLNEENAKEAAGAVRDILENDTRLREEVLGPSLHWKPQSRSGKSWTDGKFTVGTRRGVGTKSPTMRAVGKGGKLLSKDADLVVADDIQDKEAHESPTSRESDVRWMNTQVSSRKEAHTALLVIGSRQHHEDLYGRLEANVQWRSIVESAHAPSCPIPLHSPRENHTADCLDCARHHDCLLWPDKRTMAYLQDQRAAMEDDVLYEMVYDNRTRPPGDSYVTQAQIDACKNEGRSVGRWIDRANGRKHVTLPPGRLIAGLDPASMGMQASFLWSYDPTSKVRYAVDVDNRSAGSTAGARFIIREWYELYGCQRWIIERNNFQLAIIQDPDLIAYCQEFGITVEPHFTDKFNKWDPKFGVPKQLEAFGLGLIDLPWGDEETRNRFAPAIKQWVHWSPKSNEKDDIPMAAWFPERTFLRWRRDQQAESQANYQRTGYFDRGLADQYVGV